MSIDFGKRLKLVRSVRGLTQHQLASTSGITRSVIASMESGRREDITVSEVVTLARALDVEPATLCPELAASESVRARSAAILRLRSAMDDVLTSMRTSH